MKYRYLLVMLFEDVVVGTNDEAVVQEWKDEFGDDAATIIDLATMQFQDIGTEEWKQVEEHKQ